MKLITVSRELRDGAPTHTHTHTHTHTQRGVWEHFTLSFIGNKLHACE